MGPYCFCPGLQPNPVQLCTHKTSARGFYLPCRRVRRSLLKPCEANSTVSHGRRRRGQQPDAPSSQHVGHMDNLGPASAMGADVARNSAVLARAPPDAIERRARQNPSLQVNNSAASSRPSPAPCDLPEDSVPGRRKWLFPRAWQSHLDSADTLSADESTSSSTDTESFCNDFRYGIGSSNSRSSPRGYGEANGNSTNRTGVRVCGSDSRRSSLRRQEQARDVCNSDRSSRRNGSRNGKNSSKSSTQPSSHGNSRSPQGCRSSKGRDAGVSRHGGSSNNLRHAGGDPAQPNAGDITYGSPPRQHSDSDDEVTEGTAEAKTASHAWDSVLELVHGPKLAPGQKRALPQSRAHGGGGAAPAITVLTSPPARAVAAAARALAAHYQAIEAHSTGTGAIPAAAITAAAAAASVAAAAEQLATAIGLATTAVKEAPKTAADGRHEATVLGTAHSYGVLWPLLPSQLETLVKYWAPGDSGAGRLVVHGDGYSYTYDHNGRSGGSHIRNGDADEASMVAAATELLEEVAGSILEHGVYPVRSGATKLRAVVQEALKSARAAAAAAEGSRRGTATPAAVLEAEAAERMEELLLVPKRVMCVVVEVVAWDARYMNAAQVAAVLVAVGALALTLNRATRGALTDRALELLEAGIPPQHRQQQHQQRHTQHTKALRPLPPPLAALLMLLLVTVLPQELSHRQVRWLMWNQLRMLLLPPSQRRRDALEGAAPAADALGAVDVPGDAPGGGAAEAAEAEAGGMVCLELPLVAVAALIVAGDRLQVLLHASDVEEAALQRLSRNARQMTARQVVTLLRCRTDKQGMLGSDVLARFVSRLSSAAAAGALPPAEVPPLLELLADQVVLLDRRELSQLAGGIFRAIKHAAEQAGPPAAAAGTPATSLLAAELPAASPATPSALPGAATALAGAEPGAGAAELRRLAAVCGELEAVLGRLKLLWADPDLLVAVREELAGFSASGGAHPEAALQAWQALMRSPDFRTVPRVSLGDPDNFIDQAREELLRRAAGDPERGSVLEGLVRPAALGEAEAEQAWQAVPEGGSLGGGCGMNVG